MKHLGMIAMVSSAALALSACSSEDVENTPVDDIDEIVDEDENYPVGGEMNEDQQANYDAMDRQAVSDEYDANREQMMSESGAMQGDSMQGDSMQDSGDGSMMQDGDDAMAGGSANGSGSMDSGDSMSGSSMNGSSGSSSWMRSRSAMDFGYLDHNDDGQLSVAEYAVWALPTNPNPPEPNDARGPHLTTDEINTAGETFFYFDQDGDSYLSQEEFQNARNSSRTM